MEELKEKIKQLIAPNGKNAITAQVLQNVLLEIVDELKAECGSLGTSVDELETNDKNQDERITDVIDEVNKNTESISLINQSVELLIEASNKHEEDIEALEQADAAIVKQLQGQGDSITANTTAIEDLNTQIGDIDAVLTEIIGGE
jgi:chromosome segregation ATPase